MEPGEPEKPLSRRMVGTVNFGSSGKLEYLSCVPFCYVGRNVYVTDLTWQLS
jgi:hypothetical protein